MLSGSWTLPCERVRQLASVVSSIAIDELRLVPWSASASSASLLKVEPEPLMISLGTRSGASKYISAPSSPP